MVALNIAGAIDIVWHAGLIENPCAKDIQGDFLMMLDDYL